jgi:GGDEF domain-containing protein
MKTLRLSVVLLLIYLTFFYNIERLDFNEANIIDVPSFIYIQGIIAVVSILTIPFLYRSPRYVSFVVWGVIYAITRYILVHNRPVIGGIYTYIFITEIAFLTATLFLSYNVARNLYDFEQAIENITFGKIRKRVRSLDEAKEEIKSEILRGRRYRRPISLMVMKVDPASVKVALQRTVEEVQRAMMERYVFLGLARLISKQTRRIDILVEQEGKEQFLVLCPETDTSGVTNALGRIQQAARENLGLTLSWGVASFPDEALTFEDLLQKAEENMTAAHGSTGQTRANQTSISSNGAGLSDQQDSDASCLEMEDRDRDSNRNSDREEIAEYID